MLAFLAIVALLILFNLRRTYAPESRSRSISGAELALKISSFVDSFVSGDDLFASKVCMADGACHMEDKNILPAFAWRMHQGIAQLRLGKRERGEKILREALEGWIKLADTSTEQFSTHQLHSAFEEYDSDLYLGWFWGRAALLDRMAHRDVLSGRRTVDSFLVATLARQMALAASILRDKNAVGRLSAWGQFQGGPIEVEATRQQLLGTARALVSLAAKLVESDGESPLLSDGAGRLGQFACWPHWAELALYEATDERAHLASVDAFLRRVDFGSRTPSELTVVSMQSVLPCLEMLIDRVHEEVNPTPEFRAAYQQLVRTFVLPNWDSDLSKPCEGDNGVFAVRKADRLCIENGKSIADNSWLASMFSRIGEEIFTMDAVN